MLHATVVVSVAAMFYKVDALVPRLIGFESKFKG